MCVLASSVELDINTLFTRTPKRVGIVKVNVVYVFKLTVEPELNTLALWPSERRADESVCVVG